MNRSHMKLIDISWPITEDMTGYKDRRSARFIQVKTIEKDQARQSMISLDSHAGTHLDAPSHFLQDGDTIEKIPLEFLQGECRVLDFTSKDDCITKSDLEKKEIQPGERLLFKTRNSSRSATEKFDEKFIFLEKNAAAYLVEKKVQLIGIDYLGLERNQPEHETHVQLLSNQIVIIEGLRLAGVAEGKYQLLCLPLAIRSLEAAPTRAILITPD